MVEEGMPNHHVNALAGQQTQRVQPPGDRGNRARAPWRGPGPSGTAALHASDLSWSLQVVL